jgi:GNAT superfamily N-acetyltransferase
VSEIVPVEESVAALGAAPVPSWTVRLAKIGDEQPAAEAVEEMLLELGGSSPSVDELREAARSLLEDGDAGALLLAQTGDGELVGMLGVSWQMAVRVPGRYGLIQELWVRPRWRGKAVGGDLLAALYELARERGVTRIEVGLPSERFAELPATEAFYLGNDFAPIGMRMRRLV